MIVLLPLAGIFIGVIIGLIKGTIQGCKAVAARQEAATIEKAVRRGIIPPPAIEVPETVLDEINALEVSADVYRRKAAAYQQQAAATFDPLEKLDYEEKAARATKKMVAEYKKLGKLKDKYGIIF